MFIQIILGALLTVFTCFCLGKLALLPLRRCFTTAEEIGFAFVTGAGVLSTLIFFICVMGVARKEVFFLIAAVALAAFLVSTQIWRGYYQVRAANRSSIPWHTWVLFAGISCAFFWLYLPNALAPEISPDGVTYHLGLAAKYARLHGFQKITTNMYANLPAGLEMLFLFAFEIGRHSAAAVVHFWFLIVLAFLIICYGVRFGMPVAGMAAAVLVFAAPVVGADSVIAYNDVAEACVGFAAFYLLQIWTEDTRNTAVLALAGLCAGFTFAIKYPGATAAVYGAGLICFMLRREPARILRALCVFGVAASCFSLPWLLKNWLWLGNPLSPFFNAIFPNPYVTIAFEKLYRDELTHFNGLTLAQMPLEATIHGYRASGLIGPVFLLAPLGLLGARSRQGRQLLIAALLFFLPAIANKGSRFLIPALPFIALAMTMALSRFRFVAPAVALMQAFTCWPAVVSKYAHPYTWRLSGTTPWSAALRQTPEEEYLRSHLPDYAVAKMIERAVPEGQTVYSFQPVAASYCDRDVWIAYWAAENLRLRDGLQTPIVPDYQPTRRFDFHFPVQSLFGVRAVQTAAGGSIWSIAEAALSLNGRAIPLGPQWSANARPFPWDASLAQDGRLLSKWLSNQKQFPGEFFQISTNAAPVRADGLTLYSSHDQYEVQLALEISASPGRWTRISTIPTITDVPPPAEIRKLATRELLHANISYLLITPGDYIEKDVLQNPALWGLEPVGETRGFHLFRIAAI